MVFIALGFFMFQVWSPQVGLSLDSENEGECRNVMEYMFSLKPQEICVQIATNIIDASQLRI